MNTDESAMIDFVLKWSPFGGGDEHILPTFGLIPTEFYRRVLTTLTRVSPNEVDIETNSSLREFCTSKLPTPTWRRGDGESGTELSSLPYVYK